MPKPDEVREYYAKKNSEYEGKYGGFGNTYAHVGLYDVSSYPQLFREDWGSFEKSESHLRSLLHQGQEDSALKLTRPLRGLAPGIRVMDCGAGIGGVSKLTSDRFGALVDAVTISPSQMPILSEVSSRARNGSITPILGDALAFGDWWTGGSYDAIIAMDALCQVGDYAKLVAGFSTMQKPGGLVMISDHFCRDKTSPESLYFDEYWVSDVSTLETALSALTGSGYSIVEIIDHTATQLPFWKLSISYGALSPSDRTPLRNVETLQFHRQMHSAYTSGAFHYYQILARLDRRQSA